jgi:hypothetical protein
LGGRSIASLALFHYKPLQLLHRDVVSMAGCMRGPGRFAPLSTLWRYEADFGSATIGHTCGDADLQRAYDQPHERVYVAGLLGSFVLRL